MNASTEGKLGGIQLLYSMFEHIRLKIRCVDSARWSQHVLSLSCSSAQKTRWVERTGIALIQKLRARGMSS